MPKPAAIAFAVVAFASPALAAGDDALRQQIVGDWGRDPQCSEGALSFAADGAFRIDLGDEPAETGTWEIVDGILSGVISDGSDKPDMTVRFEGDTLYLGSPDASWETSLYRCPEGDPFTGNASTSRD